MGLVYYSHKNDDIIISRDRFGEKPLYYSLENQKFFSNSIKAIHKLNKKKLYFNDNKIENFIMSDKIYGLDNQTFENYISISNIFIPEDEFKN